MGLKFAALTALLAAAVPAFAQVPPPPPPPPGASPFSQSFQFAPSPFDNSTSTASAPKASTGTVAASTGTVAASTGPVINLNFGQPLSSAGGPWVFGESLFTSGGKIISDYAWRDKLHGHKDQLYTAADLQADVDALKAANAFDRVSPVVYAMPNTPIPAQFAVVSVSTSEVRVVFDVVQKVEEKPQPKLITPPVAVSGLILTPTAYRGLGHYNTPGLGLDFNAAYYIGRLYGKNDYPFSPEHTSYLDRIGLWLLEADGKMQLQSETEWRPATAVGTQGILMFHDAPAQTVAPNNNPAVGQGVTADVSQQTVQLLGDAYFVASKDIKNVRYSAGVMEGTIGDLAENLSEYLTNEELYLYKGAPQNTVAETRTVPFVSAFYLLKPDYPIGFEIMKFNGAAGNPMLINMKIGRLLKLNFDLGLLTFSGGYDLLGLVQFRFNQFPNK
jgi:hypothetical protein